MYAGAPDRKLADQACVLADEGRLLAVKIWLTPLSQPKLLSSPKTVLLERILRINLSIVYCLT